MNTQARCTRTGIRLAFGLGAIGPLLLFGAAGVAAAATADVGAGMDSIWVHISDLRPAGYIYGADKCDLTYDANTSPSVGGDADTTGHLNFDSVSMSRGDHTVVVNCYHRGITGSLDKTPYFTASRDVHVGPS